MKTNVKIAMGMVLLAMAVYASPAGATLLAYEGFDYADAALQDADGGYGFAGAWNGSSDVSNDGTSIAHTGTANTMTGGRLSNAHANGSKRALATTLTFNAGDEWYMSWLMKPIPGNWLALKLSNGAHSAGEYSHRGFMFYQSGSNYAVGGSSAPAVNWDGGYTAGDTMFVVAQIKADPANSRWINAVAIYESPDAAPASFDYERDYGVTSGDDSRPLDHIQFWGAGGGEMDEFRIGTTYEDVVGSSEIPEPASLLFLATGMGLMLIRRR